MTSLIEKYMSNGSGSYEPSIRDCLEFENLVLKNILSELARMGKTVTFYTRNRSYIDNFRAIDKENKPFTLSGFMVHGGIVYYKKSRFEWGNIETDNILKIEW